jgi:hypothetical protein
VFCNRVRQQLFTLKTTSLFVDFQAQQILLFQVVLCSLVCEIQVSVTLPLLDTYPAGIDTACLLQTNVWRVIMLSHYYYYTQVHVTCCPDCHTAVYRCFQRPQVPVSSSHMPGLGLGIRKRALPKVPPFTALSATTT